MEPSGLSFTHNTHLRGLAMYQRCTKGTLTLLPWLTAGPQVSPLPSTGLSFSVCKARGEGQASTEVTGPSPPWLQQPPGSCLQWISPGGGPADLSLSLLLPLRTFSVHPECVLLPRSGLFSRPELCGPPLLTRELPPPLTVPHSAHSALSPTLVCNQHPLS